MTIPLKKPVEHYIAEVASAPALAQVPEGSYYFPQRPDLIVVLKGTGTLTIDQTARVLVSRDSYGREVFILSEDTRAEGDCDFGDPTDGTVFSCDRVPLRIRAGTQLRFINQAVTLNQAA